VPMVSGQSALLGRECCAACMWLLIRVHLSRHRTCKGCMVLVLRCAACMLSNCDCRPPRTCTVCCVHTGGVFVHCAWMDYQSYDMSGWVMEPGCSRWGQAGTCSATLALPQYQPVCWTCVDVAIGSGGCVPLSLLCVPAWAAWLVALNGGRGLAGCGRDAA
jgi:hypothetical protein